MIIKHAMQAVALAPRQQADTVAAAAPAVM